jgi:putative oxidoreductase
MSRTMTSHGMAPPLRTDDRGHGRIADVLRRLDAVPLALPQLMARIAVGAVFWKSGLTKTASWATPVALFRDEYRLPVLSPELAAMLATAIELSAPVLLVLGLGARLGAAGLLGMTAAIQLLVYPENWAEHLTWATLLLLILIRGAGPVSLDHLVSLAVARRG